MSDESKPPTVGRIVHYKGWTANSGLQCMAAMVTEPANGMRLGLTVFDPRGIQIHAQAGGGVPCDDSGETGHTWHWPERA